LNDVKKIKVPAGSSFWRPHSFAGFKETPLWRLFGFTLLVRMKM